MTDALRGGTKLGSQDQVLLLELLDNVKCLDRGLARGLLMGWARGLLSRPRLAQV